MTDEPDKGGRPAQTTARSTRPQRREDRRKWIGVKITTTSGERDWIRAQAAHLGISISDLLRREVFGRPLPVPALNREAWVKLGALAAELNQYMRAVHQGRAAAVPQPLLEQLHHDIVALRGDLLVRDRAAE
jgi:hypothetical protein